MSRSLVDDELHPIYSNIDDAKSLIAQIVVLNNADHEGNPLLAGHVSKENAERIARWI